VTYGDEWYRWRTEMSTFRLMRCRSACLPSEDASKRGTVCDLEGVREMVLGCTPRFEAGSQ
jgi:hypothetical protein